MEASDGVLGLADCDDALHGKSLPLTKKEDRLLVELVRRHGRKWMRIKQIFEKKTSRRTLGQKGYSKRYDSITRGSGLHVPADQNAPAAKKYPRVPAEFGRSLPPLAEPIKVVGSSNDSIKLAVIIRPSCPRDAKLLIKKDGVARPLRSPLAQRR